LVSENCCGCVLLPLNLFCVLDVTRSYSLKGGLLFVFSGTGV
jgi:hypothetical protein